MITYSILNSVSVNNVMIQLSPIILDVITLSVKINFSIVVVK